MVCLIFIYLFIKCDLSIFFLRFGLGDVGDLDDLIRLWF